MKITINKNGGFNYIRIMNNLDIYIGDLIFSHPFENCQTFTLGAFYKFIDLCRHEKNYIDNLIQLRNTLNDITNKRVLIVDIKAKYFNLIKNEFPIKSSVKYISSNGSHMILTVINLSDTALRKFRREKLNESRS